ncbi:VOC family protein [Actinomycetospora straminea]|uniref:VOC domain-containing protein n=1 Tax=Actinomycetospora straminea TaxID=663607 RepID=A0ABP9EBZ3_9PSEU|nr:VOC family protein [Actinomycetospora straminea]MDD7932254.1 VOC family protein [Actinomycetospora straminea]
MNAHDEAAVQQAAVPADAGLLYTDHVAVAVRDPREGVALFVDALGGRFLFGGDNDQQGIRIVQVVLPGGMKIELISPLRDDAPVARFLEKRGPGVHHITLVFADVEVAVARLTACGYEVVDVDLSAPHWREAFVRPRSGLGTLLQLADTTLRWDTPAASGVTLDDVLAGRVVFTADERAVLRDG